jgi:transketolase
MRAAFIEELTAQARENRAIFLVVGDLGYSVVEKFADEFPDRFLNVGVAEQNMMGVAAGLASEGYHVFTYSIANFPTFRCLEQIRNDICYHNLPVTIVSVGAGLAYGNLGYSHHGVQDVAVMRSLPFLTLLNPSDLGEAVECVRYLSEHPHPSFLRLGKDETKILHNKGVISPEPMEIHLGDGQLAIAATGAVLATALEAQHILRTRFGKDASVYSCPWIKPLNSKNLAPLWLHEKVFTIEEHVAEGGFGELVCRLATPRTVVHPIFMSEDQVFLAGGTKFLREAAGISAESVVEKILTTFSHS